MPVGEQGAICIERFVFGKDFSKSFGCVGFENNALLAFAAERFKESGGGLYQPSAFVAVFGL